MDRVIHALTQNLTTLLEILPHLGASLLIIITGFAVAGIVRRLVMQILKVFQLEPFAEKVGLSGTLRGLGSSIGPSELIGDLVKWSIVIAFLIPASEVLGLDQVAPLVQSILGYIPNVIVAVMIIMFGMIIADLSADFVRGTAQAVNNSTSNFLAEITKYMIISLCGLASLSQLKVAQELVHTLFTGLVAMLALAGGLAFGLGGKDLASEILENLKKSLQED